MDGSFLGLSVFIACVVEMVEALTIILAIGVTRGWRSTLLATGAALVCLVVIVGVFGKTLMHSVSNDSNPTVQRLWIIMGGLLLIFGLQWTKKGILRFTSILPSRDETKVYNRTVEAAKETIKEDEKLIDWYGFVIVFKGVLIEGLEVVFILITFSATQNNLRVGIIAALIAFLVVALMGILIHKPLSRVPENTMKLIVGVLLTTFGTYFSTKGVGVQWPHGEVAIAGILVFYVILTYVFIRILKNNYLIEGAKERD
jgi:uncharacterized membrane protein